MWGLGVLTTHHLLFRACVHILAAASLLPTLCCGECLGLRPWPSTLARLLANTIKANELLSFLICSLSNYFPSPKWDCLGYADGGVLVLLGAQ